MSVRRAPVGIPPEPEVSIRLLLIAALAAALGAIAWRFPFTVNPMLVGVATFAVLDRMTNKGPKQ
jgi:hypothetical protein